MARMGSEPAPDLSLHPSPVLTEAVLKVEQVVARLQDLQTTISGLHLSPVNPKHTRASRTSNATNRILSSKERTSIKEGAASSQHRDEYTRNVLRDYRSGSRAQLERTTKFKGTLASPSNQVHDVISEILVASQFAKQIATLVAEALQEAPQKSTHPRSRSSKNGKQKDTPFPGIKSKDAKVAPTKDARFVPASRSKLFPAAKPVSKRRVSRESSSPDSLTPPRRVVHSPEQKRRHQRLVVTPESSFRDSGDADDELSFPRRVSTNVTEIRGLTKPWKRTPTKGVLFSNPVYLCTSPTRAPRPSPTSGRRRSLLPNQQLMPERKEPVRTSFSKVTFKRDRGLRKSVVEMVPHRTMSEVLKARPRNVLQERENKMVKPANVLIERKNEMMKPDSHANVLMERKTEMMKPDSHANPLMERKNEMVKPDSHANPLMERKNEMVKPDSHANPLMERKNEMVKLDSHAYAENEESFQETEVSSEKENVPSCGPAVMFLRSMSGAHTLTRTLSRKNSGGSLFRRAKGWMSSQAIRPGKGTELER